MPAPSRGEVWLVDLGMVAKARPCLVLSVSIGPQDRVLATVIGHTTSTRGSQFEVPVKVPFLQAGAFDAQSLVMVHIPMEYVVRLEQHIGRPLAIVRRRAASQELSRVVPDACGTVWNVIRSQQFSGAGRHVAVYLDGQINLEVGVELDGPFSGYGEVVASSIPPGLVAATTHFGPYGRLHEAHEAIRRWCAHNGHTLAGPNWEIYGHWEVEWNSDPSKICTNVFYLLLAGGGSAAEQVAAPDHGGS